MILGYERRKCTRLAVSWRPATVVIVGYNDRKVMKLGRIVEVDANTFGRHTRLLSPWGYGTWSFYHRRGGVVKWHFLQLVP
jgi:hypothetical protein